MPDKVGGGGGGERLRSSLSTLSSAVAFSASSSEEERTTTLTPIDLLVTLANEMSSRAATNEPLTESELSDVLTSLRNVAPPPSDDFDDDDESGGVDWSALERVLSKHAHLSHKDWDRTGMAASDLRSALLPTDDDHDKDDGGLSVAFRSMFRRVLEEGRWDQAADHAGASSPSDRPWAVLVTGVNGIRKTTSIYQDWFGEVLSEALVSPEEEETEGGQRGGGGEGEGGRSV